MNRKLIYWLVALLTAALIGAGVWGMAWLTGSAEGTRWLLDSLSRHTAFKISAGQVEGRLRDRLQLSDLHVTLAPFQIEIERLTFHWRPFFLLTSTVAVQELTLAGVHIQDNTPEETPPDLAWPRVPGVVNLFHGKIERLRVDDLTYRHLDKQPVRITAISSSLSFQNAFFVLPNLAVQSPLGSAGGSVVAGFARPSLRLDLALTPANPVAGMDGLSVQTRLSPGRHPEQLAGKFTAALRAGKINLLELTGELGMTRQAFNLRQLRLAAPGGHGQVTGGGTVALTTREPILDMRLKAASLDLSSELAFLSNLSGTMTFRGTPKQYGGEFAIAGHGKAWQRARLAGAYRGDDGQAKTTSVEGTLLGGTLQGNLIVDWRKEISLSGAIQGRNIDPAAFAPDWQGIINFDLAGSLAWPRQSPPRWELNAKLLSSRLHGQALTGEAQLTGIDNDIRIGSMAIRGKGFEVAAKGALHERLALTARVDELGQVIPGTTGNLRAQGWVRWRDGRLSGDFSARGGNLAAGEMRVANLQVTASLGEKDDSPLHVVASLRKPAYNRFQAETVTLDVEGSPLHHTLKAALHSPDVEAHLALAGTYHRGGWQGKINGFSGRNICGPWNLGAPAPLSFSAGMISLAPLVVRGPGRESLEISGELNRKPLEGSIRARWEELNIACVNPWLKVVRVAGSTNGNIQVGIKPGEQPVFIGRVRTLGTAKAEAYGITAQRASLIIEGGKNGLQAMLEFQLAGGGTGKGVFSSPGPARLSIPEQGEMTAEWTGIGLAPFLRQMPREIAVEGSLEGRMAGKLFPGKRLDLSGKIALARGKFHWQRDKDAFAAALHTASLSWSWRGALSAPEATAGQLAVTLRTGASGVLIVDGRSISLPQVSLNLDGNEQGLEAKINLALAGGGDLKGRFSSATPPRPALPGAGQMELEWNGIDLAIFRPWLPRALNLEGRLTGRTTGNLLPERRLAIQGEAALSGGKIRWFRPEGEINAALRSASLTWEWRGEALRGAYTLSLAEEGQARGSFQLPLAARLSPAFAPKGPLAASLTGRVREQGLIASLFPGFVQESHGELEADLQVGGSWEEPTYKGYLHLAKAGAYLPTAGIHVRDVELALHLEKDLLRIASFRMSSGPGLIEGTASVQLRRWQVIGYSGSINGDRFQAIYLPELQILCTPRLNFEGTPKKLAIRGELRLPELLITGLPTRDVVLPSKDVIIEGVPEPAAKTVPLALDVQVRLVLGDNVLVKLAGIDAKLEGNVELIFTTLNKITSRGVIRVAKGRYKAYGVDLEIVRGRLFYAGGPINQPTLDIMALRTSGSVRAGIMVAGNLQKPVIKLYSEPPMPDVDILSYLVLGQALTRSAEQAGTLAQAAASLLSRGQSAGLQEQLKQRLGLSTLEIQAGTSVTTGNLGYKAIPVTPPGFAPTTPTGEIAQAMFTVGKYLTPQVYFSYGKSLFTGANLFRLRYDIFKKWQIETQTGTESSMDIYYKIDFK